MRARAEILTDTSKGLQHFPPFLMSLPAKVVPFLMTLIHIITETELHSQGEQRCDRG